jgi:threonine dehydrogenase-like Zn-dependent dehydrogenase
MRAVRSNPPGVSVVDVDEPEGPGELVQIRSASICSSDFAYIDYGSTSILGHELAGVTEDGRAVSVEAIFGCGECELCLSGRYNLCPTTGTTQQLGNGVDGGMSEWFRVPSDKLVELPEGLSPADACLVEPLAVALHGCHLVDVGPGSRVAVVGGGAVGLFAVAAARALGAAEVSLEARHPHQIEKGERLGATQPSGRYDIVFEAAGTESSLKRSVSLVARGGTMGVLGVCKPGTEWPYWGWFMKEVRTQPSIGYCGHAHGRDVDAAAKLLAASPDLIDTMITHRFPIDDASEAFRVAGDRSTGSVRVVIEPSPA